MGDLILKYELDLTGRHPNNRVLNEEHTLTPGVNRSAVMRYGAYYTQDMIVRDGVTGAVLDKGTQYMAVMYWSDPSERSGLEVCVALVITDPSVSNTINVDVNYVGGLYQNVAPVIIEAIDNLNLDDRPIMWGDLLGRPDAFPPSAHLHDLGDIYGFEYLVEQLAAIREAILYGDVASHEELKRLIEDRYDDAVRLMNIIDDRLTIRIDDHLADKNNPHGTTKAQVGLGNVQNYNVATEQQAIAGTANDRYMTALRVAQAINTQALLPLNDHINNKDNPHEVTKTQVGLSNVQNYGISNEAQAVAGTLNTVYMTPLRVSQAISNQAIIPLQAHINDKNNPHSVTKAQVGLGSVQNYGISSETDAAAGTLNNSYMTPLRVAQAITKQTGSLLQGHIDDKANPHNVTKAQVGLGSVQDYGVASEAQAIAGTANNRYMTPLRVAQAITSQAGSLLKSHVDDKNNPHNVTKAQVGLGNVQNYSVATQEEAIDGVVTNKYMTPQGVAQAITQQAGLLLQGHISDTTNPHNVTKSQVGLGNVQNYGTASNAQAAAGTASNLYVTPAGLKHALDTGLPDSAKRGEIALSHLNSTTNTTQGFITGRRFQAAMREYTDAFDSSGNYASLRARGTTKADVGLSNVPNWSGATQAQAVAGTANNTIMTPLRVSQAISAFGGSGDWDIETGDWGYARHRASGLCLQWGTSPAADQNQGAWQYYRLPFTGRPFSVVGMSITFSGDAGILDELNEITQSIPGRTISNVRFMTVARRLSGGRTDKAGLSWLAIGIISGDLPTPASTRTTIAAFNQSYVGMPTSTHLGGVALGTSNPPTNPPPGNDDGEGPIVAP